MPKKFVCEIPADELRRLYLDENRTIAEMCGIVGVKSSTTMAKILHEKGIDTNKNAMTALKNRHGMNEDEFKSYLIERYKTKNVSEISRELGINQVVTRRYFEKYGIAFKPTREAQASRGEKNGRWKGGVRKKSGDGYIEVFCPDHPRKNKRNCVYQHDLVMEAHLGRYLEDGEVVHHKDFCKTNNNIENLELMNKSTHMKLHWALWREEKESRQ